MPDGNIQLSVTLTTEDVKKKSVELRSNIQKIFESTDVSKATDSMRKLMTTMGELSDKAATTHQMLHQMETTKVVNPRLKELREEVKQAAKDIEYFSLLRKKMLDEGVDKDGEEYNKVTEAMFNAIHKSADATVEIGKIYDSGQAKITEAQADPETYNALKIAQNELNNEMVVTTAQFNEEKQAAEGASDGVAQVGESVAQASPRVSSFNKHVSRLTSSIRGKLSKALGSIKGAFQKAFSFKGITQGLKRLIQYTFGVYSLVSVFNKLKNAAKEGMQNLVRYQSGTNATNKAMTEFNTSLLYIKNAWAAAFAPVINFVMPVLTQLMDMVAQVGNTVARFVGVLTGQKQVLQAVRVSAGDYAKSLDKTGKAANKAKNQLAAYDKLLVINSDNGGDGSGGANSDTPSPDDMFKRVDVDESEFADILEFIDKIKQKIKESGIVEAFENLKKAFDNFKDSPIVKTLKDILEIVTNDVFTSALGIFTDALNLLAAILNGDFLGAFGSFRDILADLTFDPLIMFADIIDRLLGTDIGTWLREVKGAIKDIDISELPGYEKLKDAWDKLKVSTENLRTALQNFWKMLKDTGILDMLKDFIVEVVKKGLDVVLRGLATSLEAIADALSVIADVLNGDFYSALNDLKNLLATITLQPLETIASIIDSVAGTDLEGWLKGVEDAIKDFDLSGWLTDPQTAEDIKNFIEMIRQISEIFMIDFHTGGLYSAIQLLIEYFKDPELKKAVDENPIVKTVMSIAKIFGANVATGGLYSAIQLIVSYFTDPDLKNSVDSNPIVQTLTGIAKIFSANIATGGLYSAILWLVDLAKDGKFGEGIKKFVTDPIGTIKTTLNFESIKTTLTTTWENIKGVFTGFWGKIKGVFEGKDSVVEKIKKNFDLTTIKTNISTLWSGVTGFFTGTWDKIKGAFTGKNSIAEKIKKNFSLDEVKKNISGAWSKVTGVFTGAWDKLKDTFDPKKSTSLISKIKTAILGTAAKVNGKNTYTGGIVGNILSAFETLKDKIKSPLNAVISFFEGFVNTIIEGINRLTGKINGLSIKVPKLGGGETTYGFKFPELKKVTIPRLAQGAVIPPNKEFMAMLGDQTQGMNIETPLDTMVEAFKIALADGGGHHDPVVLQLDGRVVAQAVWDEETKRYKQTGFGLSY